MAIAQAIGWAMAAIPAAVPCPETVAVGGLFGLNYHIWATTAVMRGRRLGTGVAPIPCHALTSTGRVASYWRGRRPRLASAQGSASRSPGLAVVLPSWAATTGVVGLAGYGVYTEGLAAVRPIEQRQSVPRLLPHSERRLVSLRWLRRSPRGANALAALQRASVQSDVWQKGALSTRLKPGTTDEYFLVGEGVEPWRSPAGDIVIPRLPGRNPRYLPRPLDASELAAPPAFRGCRVWDILARLGGVPGRAFGASSRKRLDNLVGQRYPFQTLRGFTLDYHTHPSGLAFASDWDLATLQG